MQNTSFLEWTGLHHSLPLNLTNAYHNPDYTALNPSFKIDCSLFDVTKKKSKVYYSLFACKKACFHNNASKLKCEFNLTDEALKRLFFFSPFSCFCVLCQVPSGSKYWTLYSTRIQNYANSITLQIISVLSANMKSQKQCSISFMIVLFQFSLERFSIILFIFDKTIHTS